MNSSPEQVPGEQHRASESTSQEHSQEQQNQQNQQTQQQQRQESEKEPQKQQTQDILNHPEALKEQTAGTSAKRLAKQQQVAARPIIKPMRSKNYIKDDVSSSENRQKSNNNTELTLSTSKKVAASNPDASSASTKKTPATSTPPKDSKVATGKQQGKQKEQKLSNQNGIASSFITRIAPADIPKQRAQQEEQQQSKNGKAEVKVSGNSGAAAAHISSVSEPTNSKAKSSNSAKPTKSEKTVVPVDKKVLKATHPLTTERAARANVSKVDHHPNNRIVVETETVDSSPIVSLALYDKQLAGHDKKDGSRNDEKKERKIFELSGGSNTNVNNNTNVPAGGSSTGNDSNKTNGISIGNTATATAAEGANSANEDHDFKREDPRIANFDHEHAKSRVSSIYGEKPKTTANSVADLSHDSFEQHRDAGTAAPDTTNFPEGISDHVEHENGNISANNDEKLNYKASTLNTNMPHSAYSRSLRNKRSILMDAASLSNVNVSSSNMLPPKISGSGQSNPSAPNLVTTSGNIGAVANSNIGSTYQDDDTRSITSSIKKQKPKPRLKKISSSRADIFEAQVEDALFDDQNSDGNETFVYESRGHSRDNSTNTIELDAESVTNAVIANAATEEPKGREKPEKTQVAPNGSSLSAKNAMAGNNDTIISGLQSDVPHRRKVSNMNLPLQNFINDQTENFKLEKSNLRGVPRNSSGPIYAGHNGEHNPQERAKYTKQGKAYKKTKLGNKNNHDDSQNEDHSVHHFTTDDNNEKESFVFPSYGPPFAASLMASASVKDFDADANLRDERNNVDDQNSMYNYGSSSRYLNNGDINDKAASQKHFKERLSKPFANDPYNFNLSSSHENTSDSELEYTTDDFTYPKFTRYKKTPSKYNIPPTDTHVLNNASSIADSNSSAITSINNSNVNTIRHTNSNHNNGHNSNYNKSYGNNNGNKGHRYVSRNSSISNMEKKKKNNINDGPLLSDYTNTPSKVRRSNSRSPVINYHPHNYRRYSQRLRSRQGYGNGAPDGSPTKNIQAVNGESVKTGHQYNSYSKAPLPNQLRTTISKLFDPQGTNLKRYSGVPDDFNVDDLEDENYDDDVNYFGYDLEDGSEINESTPLNFDYYNSYNRSPKLRNMNSHEDAKMNAYRNSRMRSTSNFKDNTIGSGNGASLYSRQYYRKNRKSCFQMIQSTFWGVFLMVSFLSLGFVCGFFLASTKDLADVNIVDIKHILVSVDELIFDIQCNGINPGFTSILVDDIDLDLFVKTRYLDEGDNYDGLFNYETFFIGNIQRLEYPLVFPSNLLDKKKVEATSGIRLIDPGKNASDPTYNDDLFLATPVQNTVLSSTADIVPTQPANDSVNVDRMESRETERQKNWKIAIKHPFELIARGKFNYKLPFGSSMRAIAVHKSISVDPAKSSGR